MKYLIRGVVLGAFFLSSAAVLAADRTISLAVKGMTCASCPYIIKKSLTKVDGVKEVEVSLETRLAVVTFDDAKTNIAAMTEATTLAGFPSQLNTGGTNIPSSAAAPNAATTAKPRGSN